MKHELDPVINQWYVHLDKGQRFYVTAIQDDGETVEVQHFDGDLEEYTFDDWRDLDIALSEEPENWSGAIDVAEVDDYGTEITDTDKDDWAEPGENFRRPNR